MTGLRPLTSHDVTFSKAEVHFPEYKDYVESAKAVAAYIRAVELTDDNSKEVKKILANARKVTDALNDRRLDIKKQIMTSYDRFEEQIKEISSIIHVAETELRAKVREMEDAEKAGKKQEIIDLFRKRGKFYAVTELLPDGGFEHWWDNRFLNKTFKMKDIESDMVAFLERTEKDIAALKAMNGAYLEEYILCLDIAAAIAAVDERKKARQAIAAAETEEVARFIVKGKKDIRVAEMLLRENEIDYIKE